MHRLSTDGKRIYTVEDFVHPPLVNWTFLDAGEELERMPKKIETALKFNRLQAYDLETGKIQWELGKPKETHFLCAPLPVGERLHVMAQTKRELRLLTLDPKSGRLSQSMVLGKALTPVERDPIRRWNAHSLIRHEDLMICLTTLGHVIAVDLMTQKPRWIYRYKVHQKGLPWWNARPVVHGERLFLTLADDVKNLHCLNVKTGKLLWTRSKDRSLYLAGAQGERALLIQTNGCYAVHVKDGSIAWTRPTGDVCGLGTFANGRYFLPLSRGLETKKPELCEVELTNGTIRSRMPLSKSLGNVVFHRDRLLSLGVQEIRSYELIDKWLATLDRRLKKKPNDVPLRRERGTVRFHLGRLDLAIEDLKVAKKNLKGAEQEKVEQTLVEAMLRLMDRDFQKGRKHLKECERLCRNPTIAEAKLKTVVKRKRLGEFYFMLGRARESQKRYQEAITAYFRAANYFDDKKLIESPEHPALKQTVQTWLMSRMKRIRLLMSQK